MEARENIARLDSPATEEYAPQVATILSVEMSSPTSMEAKQLCKSSARNLDRKERLEERGSCKEPLRWH